MSLTDTRDWVRLPSGKRLNLLDRRHHQTQNLRRQGTGPGREQGRARMKRTCARLLAATLMFGGSNAMAALPDIESISGELNREDIQLALNPLAPWFDKANQLCNQNDLSDCRITLNVSVAAGETKPVCELADSSIKDSSIKAIYCKIIREASFPTRTAATTFILQLSDDRASSPHDDPNSKGGAAANMGLKTQPKGTSAFYAPIRDSEKEEACTDGEKTRKSDDIQRVFESRARQMYQDYSLALRNIPDMTGVVRYNLHIAANGGVTKLEVVKSDPLITADFLDKLSALIRTFDFGPAQRATICPYPLEFVHS